MLYCLLVCTRRCRHAAVASQSLGAPRLLPVSPAQRSERPRDVSCWLDELTIPILHLPQYLPTWSSFRVPLLVRLVAVSIIYPPIHALLLHALHSTACPFRHSVVRVLIPNLAPRAIYAHHHRCVCCSVARIPPPNPCPTGAFYVIHNRSVMCSVDRMPTPQTCPTGHPPASARCIFRSSHRTKTCILYKPETFCDAPSWCILTTTYPSKLSFPISPKLFHLHHFGAFLLPPCLKTTSLYKPETFSFLCIHPLCCAPIPTCCPLRCFFIAVLLRTSPTSSILAPRLHPLHATTPVYTHQSPITTTVSILAQRIIRRTPAPSFMRTKPTNPTPKLAPTLALRQPPLEPPPPPRTSRIHSMLSH
jgi:hypothetical protein